MAIQSTQPDNHSFLSPTGFKFQIQKLPNVNYFCTKAQIPDITLGQIEQDNTFSRIPIPGDKLTFGQISIEFTVDEDMKNYRELYDWMVGLGYPDNFQQRGNLSRQGISIGTEKSDGTLIITSAQYKPNLEIKFIDMYPVNLSTLDFDSNSTDYEYLKGNVSFVYRKFEIANIS